MLVAAVTQLRESNQEGHFQEIIAGAHKLFSQIPQTSYDRWSVTDAKSAADSLGYYYGTMIRGEIAEETIIGPLGMEIEKGTPFSMCDVAFCNDPKCQNQPAVCDTQTRLKLTNSLGKYLSMWQDQYTDEKVEVVLGPRRMLYYDALTRESDDEVRGRAAHWAGEIPIYDVRPVMDTRDSWMSFTVQGLLQVALRHPPVGYLAMPSATTVLAALVSLHQIIDASTPISIRAEVQRGMRSYAPPKTAGEIPGRYSSKEKSNIFHAATTLLSYVQALPLPLKPPHPIDDPWKPSVNEIPRPEPYPPFVPGMRRAKLVVVGLSGLALLAAGAAFGLHIYRRRQRPQLRPELQPELFGPSSKI